MLFRSGGKPGDCCKQDAQAACDQQHPGLCRELASDGIAQVLVMLIVGRARHQQARRHRPQQRRNLGHHAITDGQDAVLDGCGGHGHTLLQHANGKSTEQVDDDDDDAGDGIAFDELHRAIQASVELAFALKNPAPAACFVLLNQP